MTWFDFIVKFYKEKQIKNIGKVAIIIPTKGNTNLLYDCVKSFYDNCNPNFDNRLAPTFHRNFLRIDWSTYYLHYTYTVGNPIGSHLRAVILEVIHLSVNSGLFYFL